MPDAAAEILQLNEKLLDCIAQGDWAMYQELCDPTLTAIEPESHGQVVEGCKTELETHCKGVTPGEGRLLACLYAYEDKLSSRCDYALYDAAARLDQAVTALARDGLVHVRDGLVSLPSAP